MVRRPEEKVRDRAILIVRLATAAGVAGALGLTWAFSNAAASYFSGRAPAPPPPPKVPLQATPVQKSRPVVTTVVHHPAGTYAAPRPPSAAPGAAPPPPPKPVCVSTPSRPC